MPELNEYKCPACGGAMEFDSKSQKMKCPYCDTEIDVREFETAQPQQQGSAGDGSWEAAGNSQWGQGETNGMAVYVCQSCGGEIVADYSTGATTCPFCGNRVVIKGQFEGDLKPDFIIPFQLDKAAAKAAYNSHLKGKRFLPKVFKSQNHIDEIKGIYVPFWLFDVDAVGDITYTGEKLRVWTSGNTEYTERNEYSICRSGGVSFDRIPTDGSTKMDDKLMESIEPFDFSGAVPFQAAYMAGYMADRYDVDMDNRKARAEERIKKSVESAFKGTITGYDSLVLNSSNVNVRSSRYWYALYPVWILNTTWKNQKFTFAMNGQTGKMVGDLPVNKASYRAWSLILGAAFSGILGGIISLIMGMA